MPSLSFFNDPLVILLTGLALLGLFFWYFATEIETRKRNIGSFLILGIVILCSFAVYPIKDRLKGDIDIVGGSAFSLRIQPKEDGQGNPLPITTDQVDEAIRIIENRLNAMATSNPLVVRQGNDGILVQMPGIEREKAEEIRRILETVAKLELKEVSPRNNEIVNGKTLAQRVADGEEVEPGYIVYLETRKDENDNEITEPILLKRVASLDGADIESAMPTLERSDAVSVTLNNKGADKMFNLTKDMRKRVDRIAIVLDGEVISAPSVNDTLSKRFEVSGLDDPGEPKELSNALMNPLVNKLIVEQERSVSPTLGSSFVKQGILSGLAGLAITAVFILIYYHLAGIIALIALLINSVILFGVMAMFGFTFSLPGIAGLILTIGMAVDANVLIYERLREEIENGKSLKSAITSAYEKAFSSILDANLTTLIACIILISMASGSIKGFALTLTIGLIASMFSAILATRVLFRWGIDTGMLRKLSFLNLIKSANFDFIGKAKACAVFSGILFIVAITTFSVKQESALGVDFTGGTIITFQLGEDPVSLDAVNAALKKTQLTRAAIPQEQQIAGSDTLLTIRADVNDSNNIIDTLRAEIPTLGKKDALGQDVIKVSKEEVSATMGGTFLKEAIIALLVGIIGIFAYIVVRFELSFAIGAIVAVLHDILIAIGIVVLLGEQLSQIHVAAILTIAGYSINDTIIVFDRIRETVLIRTGEISDVMNEAINATLSRTVLTSSTTIFTVIILAIFGGAALRDFSITILVGLIIGTYSSIFVASPIVLWWSQRKGGNLRRDVLASTLAAEAVKAD